MDSEVFADAQVKALIAESFVPVRIDSAKDTSTYDRYGVEYIPTIIILDSNGQEQARYSTQTLPQMIDILNKFSE